MMRQASFQVASISSGGLADDSDLRPPVPRQQLVEAVGRMAGDAGEEISRAFVIINTVH